MKDLIKSINFHPELTGIGKYNGELASWLVANNCSVRVITAPPYYPQWKASPGYRKFLWSHELWMGVSIWRCPIYIPSAPTGISRIIHLVSFAITSFPIIFIQTFWRPNIILTIEPPIITAPAALLAAKLCNAKTILHIQDYEVDAAFDLGLIRGKWLKSIILKMESWLLLRFDLVATISTKMIDRAQAKGVAADKVLLFPNWVDVSLFSDKKPDDKVNHLIQSNIYRSALNLPKGAIVALYSGNMGEKQGLEIIHDVAEIIFRNSNELLIHIVMCGDGVSRKKLQKQCQIYDFIHFLDLQPLEQFPALLNMADIHLLPQRGDVADLVMPSKLTAMLASGKPILATASLGSELADTVEGSGLIVPPENPDRFYEALITLANNIDLRDSLGRHARRYAESKLDSDRVLYEFKRKMELLIS
jgi:colanic acid biosynthesis glycosyl transferase WcaI